MQQKEIKASRLDALLRLTESWRDAPLGKMLESASRWRATLIVTDTGDLKGRRGSEDDTFFFFE